MHFPQSLLTNGFAPLMSQERLDALCAQTVIRPELRTAVNKWVAKVLEVKEAKGNLKESEHERDFVLDIFQSGLSYRGGGFTGALTLRTQLGTAASAATGRGNPMDAALGHFASSAANTGGTVSVVIEAKGTDCDLDKSRNNKNQTAPEQAFGYAATCKEGTPSFVIVTNLKEIRLYRFQQRITRFWRFDLETQGITTGEEAEKNLRELAFLLDPKQLLPEGNLKARLDLILDVTEEVPPKLAEAIHKEIEKVIEGFQNILLTAEGAPKIPTVADKDAAWQGGQCLVSRMLFCGFVNKHGLLEPMLLNTCKQAAHPLNPLSKWDGIQHLFRAMDSGFSLERRVLVPHFNGGLFRFALGIDDVKPLPGPLLDNTVDAAFNLAYMADLDSGSTLLGQIFEQGLKRFEARTLKQVQEGIVYTPEYICRAVTVQTLTPLIEDAFKKADATLIAEGVFDTDTLFAFHRFRRRWDALASLRIVDPACGSGAFLASALHFIKFIAMDEDTLAVRSAYAALPEPPQLANGSASLLDAMLGQGEMDPASERAKALNILENRKPMEMALFGQDLHGEAVSYAQLAVWIKGVERADVIQQIGEHQNPSTAVLVNLDAQIVTGDSLVSKADWMSKFPSIFASDPVRKVTVPALRPKPLSQNFRHGVPPSTRQTRRRVRYLIPGFDAVLANPPYVKCQDLLDSSTKTRIAGVFPEVAQGAFDLSTPFIYLGLRDLLAPHGRMGMIAPTPWTLVDHGDGLRRVVGSNKHLEGVVHFRDFQVFEGVTTYTALWFFSAKPNVAGVWLLDAPTGIREIVNNAPFTPIHSNSSNSPQDRVIPWSELPLQQAGGRETFWPIWASCDLSIRDKVLANSKLLEDYLGWETSRGGAFQGVVVGMNNFFYVKESTTGIAGSYKSRLEPTNAFSVEPLLVRHLIDSDCVDRYKIVDSGRRAIFPYYRTATGEWKLIDIAGFPQFQSYANRHRRSRPAVRRGSPAFQGLENRSGVDSTKWWEYSRKQNLEKQSLTKLVYPTLVNRLTFALDITGKLLDNARIYGLATDSVDDGYFLLGVLNASLATWYAKRISVPKANGFFEPLDFCLRKLPIPIFTPVDRQKLIDLAKRRHEITEKIAGIDVTLPTSANELLALTDEAGQKERAIDALIQKHYGLSEDEWAQIRSVCL